MTPFFVLKNKHGSPTTIVCGQSERKLIKMMPLSKIPFDNLIILRYRKRIKNLIRCNSNNIIKEIKCSNTSPN